MESIPSEVQLSRDQKEMDARRSRRNDPGSATGLHRQHEARCLLDPHAARKADQAEKQIEAINHLNADESYGNDHQDPEGKHCVKVGRSPQRRNYQAPRGSSSSYPPVRLAGGQEPRDQPLHETIFEAGPSRGPYESPYFRRRSQKVDQDLGYRLRGAEEDQSRKGKTATVEDRRC